MRCTTPARRFPGWIPAVTLALAACQPAAGFPNGAPEDAADADAAAEAAGEDTTAPVADASAGEPATPQADSAATTTAAAPADSVPPPQAAPPQQPPSRDAAAAGEDRKPEAAAPPPPPAGPAAGRGDCRVAEPPRSAGTRRLSVFFTCGDEERPVVRVVSGSPAVLRAALEALLRGPTAEERAAGYHSFFSDATAGMLRGVAVRDGVARIDFRDFSSIIPNASSSAGSEQLLAQLRRTVFQFPTVQSAEILFDGSCDRFWNWLQRGCQRLTR